MAARREMQEIKAENADLQAQLERAIARRLELESWRTSVLDNSYRSRVAGHPEQCVYCGKALCLTHHAWCPIGNAPDYVAVEDRTTEPRPIDPGYHERCEDELQWWRQTHTDEEPPADIWDGETPTQATALRAQLESSRAEVERLSKAARAVCFSPTAGETIVYVKSSALQALDALIRDERKEGE
tara:strand:- start:195 stop:749 length:555 start_codon:yes stop_codon:yes gene_type:complete